MRLASLPQPRVRGKLAERSEQATEAAMRDSQHRLARVYVELGLHRLDSDPMAGLPWLIQAAEAEAKGSAAQARHQLRAALLIHELPKLVGFWTDVADVKISEQGQHLAVGRNGIATCRRSYTSRRGHDCCPVSESTEPADSYR